jgi:hypothetical protein
MEPCRPRVCGKGRAEAKVGWDESVQSLGRARDGMPSSLAHRPANHYNPGLELLGHMGLEQHVALADINRKRHPRQPG